MVLTCVDLASIFRRIFAYIRGGERFALRTFWNVAVLGQEDTLLKGMAPEYAGLVTDEPEEYELDYAKGTGSPTTSERHVHYDEATIHGATAQWANNVNRHHREFSQSAASDNTVFGSRSMSDDTIQADGLDFKHHSWTSRPASSLIRQIGKGLFATLERSLVVAGFAQLIFGIVIYTGEP